MSEIIEDKKSKVESPPSKTSAGKAPDIAGMSVPDTLATLHVKIESGLRGVEIDARRKEYGYNEVVEKKGHPVLRLSFIAYMFNCLFVYKYINYYNNHFIFFFYLTNQTIDHIMYSIFKLKSQNNWIVIVFVNYVQPCLQS